MKYKIKQKLEKNTAIHELLLLKHCQSYQFFRKKLFQQGFQSSNSFLQLRKILKRTQMLQVFSQLDYSTDKISGQPIEIIQEKPICKTDRNN